MILVSVIITTYNKEKIIKNTLDKCVEYLEAQDYGWEIIVVDDASTDGTKVIVSECLNNYRGNVRLLVNERNMKKGGAISSGLSIAQGEYSLLLDGDYAYPITQINGFIHGLKQCPIVIGNRTDKDTTYLVKPYQLSYIYQRYILGRIFNRIVKMLLLNGINDTQCGIKSIRTQVARDIMSKMTIFNFAFDVELLVIARKCDYKIFQIPVTYDYIDEPSSVNLFNSALVMFISLCKIWFNDMAGKYARR
jgi:dolichol-phosphate mannosyltransferase